jgi:hypothetical protein
MRYGDFLKENRDSAMGNVLEPQGTFASETETKSNNSRKEPLLFLWARVAF